MQKQKRSHNFCNSLIYFVGVAGFEPATPCSQSRCASRTALCPEQFSGGEGGIRTPGSLWDYDSLANCWFQPLTHLSVFCGFASANVHLFLIHTTFFQKKYLILFFLLSRKINNFANQLFNYEKTSFFILIFYLNCCNLNSVLCFKSKCKRQKRRQKSEKCHFNDRRRHEYPSNLCLYANS